MTTDTAADVVGAAEMMAAPGLTYRKLDHWTRLGLLHELPRAQNKSGYHRRWPAAEARVAAVMARLTHPDVGLDLTRAHHVARAGGRAELAPGIVVTVDNAADDPTTLVRRVVDRLTPERMRALVEQALADYGHHSAASRTTVDVPLPG